MMKKLEEAFDGDEKANFIYIQTVFEGAKTNTFENGKADIKKYGLRGPFGQDNTRKTMRGDDVAAKAKGMTKLINELNGVKESDTKPKEEKKPEPKGEEAEEDEFSIED
ncbi:MAG: hypothetical protein ACYTDT_09625 [Planctomycetota bacterium]|jgi:hypothetical protein